MEFNKVPSIIFNQNENKCQNASFHPMFRLHFGCMKFERSLTPIEVKTNKIRKRKGNRPDMKFRHALSAPEWRTYLEDQDSLKKRSLMEKKRKHLESIEKNKKEEEEKKKKLKLLREEEKKKKDEVKEKQLEEKKIRKMEKLEEERTKKNLIQLEKNK